MRIMSETANERIGEAITDLMLRADWLLLESNSADHFGRTTDAPASLCRATEPTVIAPDGLPDQLIVVQHDAALDDRADRLFWRVAAASPKHYSLDFPDDDTKRATIHDIVSDNLVVTARHRMINLGKYATDVTYHPPFLEPVMPEYLEELVKKIAKLSKPNTFSEYTGSLRVIH